MAKDAIEAVLDKLNDQGSAERMNEKSVTGYMRYERVESLPSFEKT